MVVAVQPDQSARVAQLQAQLAQIRERKAKLIGQIAELRQQLGMAEDGSFKKFAQDLMKGPPTKDNLGMFSPESLAPEEVKGTLLEQAGTVAKNAAKDALGFLKFIPDAAKTIVSGTPEEHEEFIRGLISFSPVAAYNLMTATGTLPAPIAVSLYENVTQKGHPDSYDLDSWNKLDIMQKFAVLQGEARKEILAHPLGTAVGAVVGGKMAKGAAAKVMEPPAQPYEPTMTQEFTPGQASSIAKEQTAHTAAAPKMEPIKPPDFGNLNALRDELVTLGYDAPRVAAMDKLEMEFYLTGGRSGRLPVREPKLPTAKAEPAPAPPIEQKPIEMPVEKPKPVQAPKAEIQPITPDAQKIAQQAGVRYEGMQEQVNKPPVYQFAITEKGKETSFYSNDLTVEAVKAARDRKLAEYDKVDVQPQSVTEVPRETVKPPEPVAPPPDVKPVRTEPVSQKEIQSVLDEMEPTERAKFATDLVELTQKYIRKPAQLDKQLIDWYDRAQQAPKAPPKPIETPRAGETEGVGKSMSETPSTPPVEIPTAKPTESPKVEPVKAELTYEEFEKQYHSAFVEMNKYTPDQIGSNHFADKMADLADRYPEYLDRLEKSQEPKPKSEAPAPEPIVTDAPETTFNKVGTAPMSKIYTDEARFQNRDKGKVAEESRRKVREEFDPINFDPIVVWEDPQRQGEYVVLSGHSRLQGLKDRGYTGEVPVRFAEGDASKVQSYAVEYANRSGAKEGVAADIRAYNAMVERGATKKEIRNTFQSDTNYIAALSGLDPGGKFLEALTQPPNVAKQFTRFDSFATWVGELRQQYGDRFTNRHENQIFDYLKDLYSKDSKKFNSLLQGEFNMMIDGQMGRVDWTPNQPLIFKRGEIVNAGTRARMDTAAAERKIDELKERRDAAKTVGEREALQADIDKLRSEIKAAVESQGDMFGQLGNPRSRKKFSSFRMDPGQEKISRAKIINYFEKELGIPIRRGRFTQRAAGIYKTREHIIRSRTWGDLPTITHEVGHHIENTKFGGFGETSTLPRFPELYKLGYDLYGKTKPAGGYYSEGFAEYLSHRMVGNDVARIAPEFHRYFEEILDADPKLRKIIDEGQALTTRWFAQGAEARIRMQRENGSFAQKLEALTDRFSREALRTSLARFQDLWTNPGATIELAEASMRGISVRDVMNSEKVKPTESAGQQYRANGFAAQSQARSMVNDGVFDYDGNVTHPSLKEVLKPVAKRIDDFWDYAIARYTLDLRERGINSGVDPLDARYVVDKLESSTFRKALDEVTEFQGQVLRQLVDAGGLSEEAYQAIRDLNPIHIPLKRIVDFRKGTPGAGQKIVDVGSPVKTMKGSGRIIRDPLEAIIEQTAQILSTANRIRVARALADMSEKYSGSGKWVEKVPMPKQVTTFALEEISRELQKAGMDITDADLSQIASIYRNTRRGVAQENIVTIWRNGELETFQLHPNLYASLMNLDGISQNMFLKIMGAPARLFRLGVTGINPEFALTTNPIRDALSFAAQSKYAKGAPLNAIGGLYRKFFPNEISRLYNRSGADMGQILGMDKNSLQEAVSEVLANNAAAKALNVVKHPVDMLREILSITESAPRRAEYSAAYKKLKNQYGEGADARLGATLASKDVTVDFSRMGKYAQYVNSLVPFFNAAIQGGSKFYRSMRDNPLRGAAFGVAMTAVSLAIWNEQKDEAWYRALPAWRKYGFWNIPVGTHEDGSTKILSLPIPFEWGIVFKAIPEAMMNARYEKDPVAIKELMQTTGTQLMPSVIPTAVKGAIEVTTNYDFFRERQIVPQWMVESRVPEDQFFESTPKTYRELGERLGYSPAKLQQFSESMLGSMPTKAIRAIEGDTRSGQMDQPADIPIVGRLFPYQPSKEKRDESDKESWERTKSKVTVLIGGGHYGEAKLAIEEWSFKHKDQQLDEVAKELERVKRERITGITQRRREAKLGKSGG